MPISKVVEHWIRRRRRQKYLMKKTASHVNSNLKRLATLEKKCRALELENADLKGCRALDQENADLKDAKTLERLDALEKKCHRVEELERRCHCLEGENRQLWEYLETRDWKGAVHLENGDSHMYRSGLCCRNQSL
eukprot:gnl/TRDRNA2_/TRDRNA2_104574_c0_seq1.p1 gnl/TRDRNA2_/TRDRNA2_104574_c0~~gnl/TRDRNA2_/TRDRNA2_104574_c0_seq1.p1  ORF type:complete len:136 (+),score=32.36 gnl/TRDRNA2_/TRDRNA2_104574_c0_seq1:304-711(+)